MSGPIAPAQNRMTPKKYAEDRIPTTGEIPMRNPGSIRQQAAVKLGVPARTLTTAPGLPQRASSTPRPQAPPVRAPVVPKPAPNPPPAAADAGVALPERLAPFPSGVPMPAPRPTAAMVNDITPQGGPPLTGAPKVTMGWGGAPIASPDQTPPTAQPEGLTGMVAKVLRDRLGMPDAGNKANAEPMAKAPAPPPDVWSSVPVPGKTLPQVVAGANQAKDDQRMQSTQQESVPMPRPRPDGANAVTLPIQAPSPPGKPPATVEVVASDGPSQGGYKPSQGTFGGYYKREEVPKESKIKGAPPLKKSANFYYYDTLGVPIGPTQNTMAAHALQRLQQRAIDDPKSITPAEDRLLSSSGSAEAYNKSMEPDAVRARFKQYQAGESVSDKAVPRYRDRFPGQSGEQAPLRLPTFEGPPAPGQQQVMPPGSAPPQIQTQPQRNQTIDPAEELVQQAIDEKDAEEEK